jgi:phage terminase small subunit
MAAGRKPKPTALKLLQGTHRKDRSRNEPKGELSRKGPSSWIKDLKAKHAWRSLENILGPSNVFTDFDRLSLELLVTTYSQWREATVKCEISVVYTEKGYPLPNPYLQIKMIGTVNRQKA